MSGIKIKLRGSAAKIVNKAVAVTLEQTAAAVMKNVQNAQVMPKDTGTLQDQSTFVYDSESKRGVVGIISDTPYARRLYYHPAYNFRTSENANAGGKWYQPWIDGDKEDFASNVFAELLRRNLK